MKPMTENNDRILRLHAALDGELDAMSALELQQTMGDDPALAAEYRRLATLREAVRRHAPRGRAPQGLMDRIVALVAPVEVEVSTGSAAILPFRRATPGPLRRLALAARWSRPVALRGRRRVHGAQTDGRFRGRRHRPRRQFRARRDRGTRPMTSPPPTGIR